MQQHSAIMTPTDLVRIWRDEAAALERYAPGAAAAKRTDADQLEAALRDQDRELLNLKQASEVSGYSPDQLRRHVREGRLPNHGTKHRPRIRRGDLPRKPGRKPPEPGAGPDLAAEVLEQRGLPRRLGDG